MKDLQGMKALITGGSSGIGKSIAVAYAEAGSDVVITYKSNKTGADETVSEIEKLGCKAIALQNDLSDENKLNDLLSASINFLGKIDILVNNAGTITRHKHFLDIAAEAFDQILLINLKVPFLLTQLVANHMISNKIEGSILNITSMSADVITPGLTHYECSKAAFNTLTKASASALASHKIRVNAIAPGLIATNINLAQRELDPDAWNARGRVIPLGKIGEPNDIAPLAVLLASKKAGWITGSIIPVDGGIGVLSPFGPNKAKDLVK